MKWSTLARTSHQLSAAAGDASHPAVFSRLGVLDVPQVRAPRPSGRKPHRARRLAALATKPGEICGLAIGLAVTVALATPAAAQQSLGDVAGSIKLKRPEGESIVIDRDTIAQSRRVSRGSTESGLFRDIVGDCLTETRALYRLIMETRDGTSFYRGPWRDRVAEVDFRLDGALGELRLVSLEGRYREAYDLAGQGADLAHDALVILRSAIADDRPVFSEARTLSKDALRFFEDAQAALGVASRANAAEETPPPINPIDADRAMAAVCGGRYGQGSSGFESCIAEQRAAVDAMAGRSGPGVGLDAASFNVIRNSCRFEWPDNFVNQDQCERQRVAAKATRQ